MNYLPDIFNFGTIDSKKVDPPIDRSTTTIFTKEFEIDSFQPTHPSNEIIDFAVPMDPVVQSINSLHETIAKGQPSTDQLFTKETAHGGHPVPVAVQEEKIQPQFDISKIKDVKLRPTPKRIPVERTPRPLHDEIIDEAKRRWVRGKSLRQTIEEGKERLRK